MNYVDYLILLVIAVGFILGYKDGFVRKLIGIFGFVLGIFLAYHFSESFSKIIAPLLNNEMYLANISAGFLIFIAVILIFSVLKRIIHPFDKVNRFVNQLLGGLAGILQIIFFLSGLLLLLNLFQMPNSSARKGSLLYQKVYSVIPLSVDLIMGSDAKAQDFIKDFIESKESAEEI